MKKEIIVVIGALDIGGAEKHITTVFPQLVSLGYSIRVVVMVAHKGILAPLLENHGIPVISLVSLEQFQVIQKLPRSLGRLLRLIFCMTTLIRLLKKEQNTLLHFFLPEAYIVGMFSAGLSRFKGPTIMSRRSMRCYQERRPILGWCETLLRNKTALVTGNSQAVMAQLTEEGFFKEKLRLIYNGLNMAPFLSAKTRSATRASLQIEETAVVVAIVANLIPYKGHADLLAALSGIKDRLPHPWYLLCVGEDRGIGALLQHQAETLKLSKHILWLGGRADVPDLLTAADIGVLCSHEEGFSNAVLEGMAAGLPMVVTDVGGNKEAVIHEETGYVAEPRRPTQLGEAILQLVLEPEKAKQLGARGRERVGQVFSMKACVDAYVNLYDSLENTVK